VHGLSPASKTLGASVGENTTEKTPHTAGGTISLRICGQRFPRRASALVCARGRPVPKVKGLTAPPNGQPFYVANR